MKLDPFWGMNEATVPQPHWQTSPCLQNQVTGEEQGTWRRWEGVGTDMHVKHHVRNICYSNTSSLFWHCWTFYDGWQHHLKEAEFLHPTVIWEGAKNHRRFSVLKPGDPYSKGWSLSYNHPCRSLQWSGIKNWYDPGATAFEKFAPERQLAFGALKIKTTFHISKKQTQRWKIKEMLTYGFKDWQCSQDCL